jgi:hypothetical protein
LLTFLVGCAATLTLAHELAIHLLSLYGVFALHLRITKLRELLYADPALAPLAQLPVPVASLFDYQLRRFGRGWLASAFDAGAFWTVAWAGQPHAPPWIWLPAIAVAYGLATEVLAFMLLRRARGLGFAWVLIPAAVLAAGKQAKAPWLWSTIEPVLHASAWLTPWGWLGTLVARLPVEPLWGPVAIVVAILALLALRWARARERAIWALHPAWRELAGRPRQAWLDIEEQQQSTVTDAAVSPPAELAATHANEHVVAPIADDVVAQALQRARLVPPGEPVRELGWAGRNNHRRLSTLERTLADLLAPTGIGDAQWRWALMVAAVPAAIAVAGVSPQWSLVVLCAIVFARGLRVAALLFFGLIGVALMWPAWATMVCLVGPCAIAGMMVIPLFGGTWLGLPMGSSVLGSVPRSWAAMMRVMLGYVGLRLLASAPIVALIAIALSFGVGRVIGIATGAAFAATVLYAPWLCAFQLIQRKRGDVELGLGRAWLTWPSCLCMLAHLIAAGTLVTGACIAVDEAARGGLMAGAGLALALGTSALHIPLLRHAYRRRVDLVAPV